MSHFKLNPPPYYAGTAVRFYGTPDANGAVLTDERVQAFSVISAFANGGTEQAKYVHAFFAGSGGTPGQPHFAQLGDIGSYFTLDESQAKAVNLGTAPVRAEFLAGASAMGLDANGQPVSGVVAYQATTVNVGTVGSEYGKICADFQHNLNVGWQG